MKYIYLIKSMDDGHYKIGVSTHPNRRLDQLQTGNPAELKLLDSYQTEHANVIEKTLHRLYSHDNKHLEWFDLNIKDVASFRQTCQKIEENIMFLKKNGNVFL